MSLPCTSFSFFCGTATRGRPRWRRRGDRFEPFPETEKYFSKRLDTSFPLCYTFSRVLKKQGPRTYCGRPFADEEIEWIRSLIANSPGLYRAGVAERFCRHVGWTKLDGGLKTMSCRVALLRMERDGLLRLPPPQHRKVKPSAIKTDQRLLEFPRPEIEGKAGEMSLRLELVERASSALWNELIERYHYLGYTPLSGAQLRYFVKADSRLLALLGFGAAAWKTAPRDEWIGWSAPQRQKNLHLVVNNARFLILPWVKVRYLASKILGLCVRRIADDWQARYAYRPVLLETFVEKDRFEGTSYKAAGWICVGQTQGRGKLDVHYEYKLPVKTVWLKPLEKDFRSRLLS
jgi:hypothetical protein